MTCLLYAGKNCLIIRLVWFRSACVLLRHADGSVKFWNAPGGEVKLQFLL